MRQISYVTVLFFLSISLLTSCSKSPKQLLIGEWRGQEFEITNSENIQTKVHDYIANKYDSALIQSNNQIEKEQLKLMKDSSFKILDKGFNDMQTMLKKIAAQSLYIFKEDMTFEKRYEEIKKGTWNIDESGKKFTMKDEDGNVKECNILEISESKLVYTVQIADEQLSGIGIADKYIARVTLSKSK
jgi:hypothetical protein